ncbi:MAG: exosortase C-terminal domain/associated protein EpsI [Desulfurivibrionaceae bacterium]
MFIPKGRTFILILLFLSCAVLVHGLDHEGSTAITSPLEQFPDRIGQWRSLGTQNMEGRIEEVLRVDDYLLANYQNSQGRRINVYISYFSRTDRYKGYHSPLNCMPGSGWEIADTGSITLELPESGNRPEVNRILLQKGGDRQIGLYWYQCRGRILANEYHERIYRVIDSIVQNRTDGAFIRLMATESEGEIGQDRKMLKNFAENLIPVLRDYLPE